MHIRFCDETWEGQNIAGGWGKLCLFVFQKSPLSPDKMISYLYCSGTGSALGPSFSHPTTSDSYFFLSFLGEGAVETRGFPHNPADEAGCSKTRALSGINLDGVRFSPNYCIDTKVHLVRDTTCSNKESEDEDERVQDIFFPLLMIQPEYNVNVHAPFVYNPRPRTAHAPPEHLNDFSKFDHHE